MERPRSLTELSDAVQRAAAAGTRVRVSASGHSFTDIALTDGVMLRMDRLRRVLDADPASGRVKVEGGIVMAELGQALERLGLAMENLGDIDRQTLAGAISTATHGTGLGFRNISAQVEAMELVLADGRLLEINAGSDPETLRAARVGLGSLGAIYSVTLRAVPLFTIRRVDRPRPLAETLTSLDALAESSDHFEFYVFPHTDVALLRESARVDDPPAPRPRMAVFAQEIVLENWAMGALARFGRRFPSRIPSLARFASRQLGHSVKVDRSRHVFASVRRIRFTEMEYGIPRAHAVGAIRRGLELASRPSLSVSFPIEVRFVAPDDALLSPSHERETCYIAVHMYRGMEWEPYFRGVEAIMDDYGGRPHWGKRHFQTAQTLAERYPRWDDFQAIRARLDPGGLFSNAYTDRVLGEVGA
jgi:L-gulonolactone oxidase